MNEDYPNVESGNAKATERKGQALLSEALPFLDDQFRQRTLISDPVRTFRAIQTLETAIQVGMTEQLLEIGYGLENLEKMYQHSGKFLLCGKGDSANQIEVGRRPFVDHTRAEWSVMFARDKLMLYDLGLIGAKDGDLRKAQLLSSPEQVLSLYRWTQFREKPEVYQHVVTSVGKRGGPYSKKFLHRLGDLMAKPAVDFREHLPRLAAKPHRRLQMFILDAWATERPAQGGQANPDSEALGYHTERGFPPLYRFKNRALFDYLYGLATIAQESKRQSDLAAILEMNEEAVGMMWRRLGLYRPGTGYWSDAELDRDRRNFLKAGKRLIIWDRKPKNS